MVAHFSSDPVGLCLNIVAFYRVGKKMKCKSRKAAFAKVLLSTSSFLLFACSTPALQFSQTPLRSTCFPLLTLFYKEKNSLSLVMRSLFLPSPPRKYSFLVCIFMQRCFQSRSSQTKDEQANTEFQENGLTVKALALCIQNLHTRETLESSSDLTVHRSCSPC